LDIKQINNEKHKVLTGVENQKIHQFAGYLAEKGIPIRIRYVLVPGYTDDENDLKETAEFIGKLGNVQRIDVLPYHSMGEYKWEQLGEKYMLHEVQPPDKEKVEWAKNILEGKIN
jgi:pyruvate formate lyase activating enzyme